MANQNNMDNNFGGVRDEEEKTEEVPFAYAKSSLEVNAAYALPVATTDVSPAPLTQLNPDQKSKLIARGFLTGLAEQLAANIVRSPVRFWVIDNSGSMWTTDGHAMRGEGKNKQLVSVTRWAEMQATVSVHSELAGLLEVTTIFHMLNHPGDPNVPREFSVAEHGSANIANDIKRAQKAMQACQPQGPTPLSLRLTEIREKIGSISSQLSRQSQKVVVCLATDGLPTDEFGGPTPEAAREFVQVLRSLQNYPVWLVVRLCTDDEETRTFYNSLDTELEMPLEVLDDFMAESKEVNKLNPWLNYGLPLHRCREIGTQHRLFDLLDERQLNREEVKEFLELLFGESTLESAPDVHTDWKGFMKEVTRVVKKQPLEWNPRTRKVEPWIDVKRLEKSFVERRTSLLAKLGSSRRRAFP